MSPIILVALLTSVKAPDFTANTSDGKEMSLKVLLKKGPVYIYFIKESCPINAKAEHFYNEMYIASEKKANFIGVIDTDKEGYATWQKKFKAPFPVVLDPEMKIINSFKAERSPWVVGVGTDQTVTKVWPGYSGVFLTELAKVNQAPTYKPQGAPGAPAFG